MKVAQLTAFGGPENIAYGELPDPQPGPGQALVRVRACALNHLDMWVRQGLPAYKISLPHILGSDIAGELQALGPGTDAPGISIGDKVLVAPGVSCWRCPPCQAGQDNICDDYSILGAGSGWGGYAEYIRVPAKNLLPWPSTALSTVQGAALPLTLLTSWHMIKTLGQVREGSTVLVTGAGSGVGVMAIQIAKALGARVAAASTSEEKLDAARELGADEVILIPKEKLGRKARQFSQGRGIDVVFEHVGGEIFSQALRALAPGGRIVTCGATSGPEVTVDLRHIFFKEQKILGAKMGPQAELREALRLVAEGKIRPVVGRTFPLEEARQAHEYLAARKQFGKVVLEI